MIVVTLFHFYCGLRPLSLFETYFSYNRVVTLFHFYCGLRQDITLPLNTIIMVVTLFHFYCGLRQTILALGLVAHLVVTLFHFYCGLRLRSDWRYTELHCRSNPFPFLLWIATLRWIRSHVVGLP